MTQSQQLSRRGTLRDWLQLVRMPNLFTAMADVMMGFLLVHAPGDPQWELSRAGVWALGLLAASSTLLYAAGVVLNDVFDLEIDREERPERPIPSGRISLRAARWLGWELLLLGAVLPWGLAFAAGKTLPGIVAVLLAGCILVYNGILKSTPLGPLAMGACRTLNVFLGMSLLAWPGTVGPAALGPEHWLVAGGIGIYIAGITWLARNEARRGDRGQLAAATLVIAAGVAMLAWLPRWMPPENLVPLLQAEPWRWYVLMGLLGAMIGGRCLLAVIEPLPGRVQTAVVQGIMSLVILNGALTYAVHDVFWAVIVLALLAPAMILGQWIRAT